MKIKNKWLLAAAALIMLGITWRDVDLSVYQQLSISDLVPIIIITVVIFLVKTGVLSAVLIGLKKLWARMRNK